MPRESLFVLIFHCILTILGLPSYSTVCNFVSKTKATKCLKYEATRGKKELQKFLFSCTVSKENLLIHCVYGVFSPDNTSASDLYIYAFDLDFIPPSVVSPLQDSSNTA